MGNRGLVELRLFASLVALFALVIIFFGFDPVITKLDTAFTALAPGRTAEIDQYVNGWRWWVPLFLGAIFLYAMTAGFGSGSRAGVSD